jgi:hypothetical protein
MRRRCVARRVWAAPPAPSRYRTQASASYHHVPRVWQVWYRNIVSGSAPHWQISSPIRVMPIVRRAIALPLPPARSIHEPGCVPAACLTRAGRPHHSRRHRIAGCSVELHLTDSFRNQSNAAARRQQLAAADSGCSGSGSRWCRQSAAARLAATVAAASTTTNTTPSYSIKWGVRPARMYPSLSGHRRRRRARWTSCSRLRCARTSASTKWQGCVRADNHYNHRATARLSG